MFVLISRHARRLSAWLRPPGTHLLERPSGEREISINRLIAGSLVFLYVATLAEFKIHQSLLLTMASVAYLFAAVVLFIDVRRRPHRSPTRRYLCLCLDLGSLSLMLSQITPYTIVMIPIYTWVAIGYAFRYGIVYLRAASALSLAGFSVVVATTPFWSDQPFLVFGVGMGLVIIPAYVEALLRNTLAALEREQASNRSKEFILSCISHDLRTPLTAMANMANELGGTILNPEQRKTLEAMQGAARSVLTDMGHLLEMSSIETAHTRVTPSEFAVLPLIHEILGLIGVEARVKGVHLGLHVTASTPLALETDRRHLGKVLLNLLHNALEATSVGSVLLTVDGAIGNNGAHFLRIAVSDTGIGIPTHLQAEIAEAYSQFNKEVLEQHRGVGLGLGVAKRLVGLLGGEVWVESNPAGTTFRVEIPVKSNWGSQTGLTGTGLILLSQEPSRLHMLAKRMERLGAKTFVVDRSEQVFEALACASESVQRLSLILDAQDLDPIATAMALRHDPLLTRVPLIMFAATRGLPPLALRCHYITSVTAASSDDELCTAVEIAAPSGGDQGDVMPDPFSPAEEAAPASSLHVLIASANQTSCAVLTEWLTRAGNTVKTVGDGDAALDALNEDAFDVALLDFDMPKTSGSHVILLWRTMEAGEPHRLPIIGLRTGIKAGISQEDRNGDCGVDASLSTPVDRLRLLKTISEVVDAQRSTRSPAHALTLAASPGITPISSHPGFTAGLGPPVTDEFDHLAIDAGPEAMSRIAHAFQTDVAGALGRLAVAADGGDIVLFRAQLHALRASANAISAGRIESLCRAGSIIEHGNLPNRGRVLVSQLNREVNRVCDALRKQG